MVKRNAYRCAFTGHRDFNDSEYSDRLEAAIRELIESGTTEFYCGMAVGFDIACAETVIKLKSEYKDIKIIACIPCPGQDRYYPIEQKRRYAEVLAECSEQIITSAHYHRGCMQVRDRYMIDNCDVVLSYLTKDTGGTYYTVKYATKSGKKVINLI